MTRLFADRTEAGRLLGERLAAYKDRRDVLVLALPRGGVPVAAEVADALGAPLDVLVVRKLGAPQQPELALGAIASGGVRVLNEGVMGALGLDTAVVDALAQRELPELRRREQAYRGERPPLDVAGRTVIVVDDGIATGATMHAALRAVRALHPTKLVAAVPVAAPDSCRFLARLADDVVCLEQPDPLLAIGVWYASFPQLTDDEVRALLEESARRTVAPGAR
ncbi:MAG TPA: phosphoribosyltransferase [Longimicrobiales bacterium]|nr:phosphoribosyltransferase [Longimicrobiales bacterium]